MREIRFSATTLCITALAVMISIGSGQPVNAQVLPVTTYTIAQGLAHNGVTDILQDERGYLWVGTGEGLSRFDGYEFRSYGTDEGLGKTYINDIAVDRHGQMWLAINDGGIASFVEDGRHDKKFASYSVSALPRAENVGQMIFDRENRMWCATEGGVFRARVAGDPGSGFEPITSDGGPSRAAFADSRDRLWFGLSDRVLRIADGRLDYFYLDPVPRAFVTGITENPEGKLLLTTTIGFYEFDEAGEALRRLALSLDDGESVHSIVAGQGGIVWMGTSRGLIEIRHGAQAVYTQDNGLVAGGVSVVLPDREGSLWLGSRGGGLSHLRSNAVVSYPVDRTGRPYRIDSDNEGNVYIHSGCHPERTQISRVTPDGLEPVTMPDARVEGCSRNHFLKTSDGRWWFVSGGALRVFDGPSDDSGVPVKFPQGAFPGRVITMYQDRTSRVWVSGDDRNLYVAELNGHATPVFELAARDVAASLILQDSRGTMWIGNNTFLGRLSGGRVEEITDIPSVGRVQPRSIFEDSRGNLWVGTRFSGVLFTAHPESDRPEFQVVGPGELGSTAVWSIAEDRAGVLYLGTGRGLVRYNPDTGAIRRFTAADSVPESAVNNLFRDLHGRLWVAADSGVVRIDPAELDRNMRPPAILINRVTVEGADVSLPEHGSIEHAIPELASDQNSISIGFVGLNLRGESSLSYRYQLEGHDQGWSPPSKQREVHFANLGSGSYRFLVKAVDQRGVESETPAVLQLQILPPFWQRWWFLGLVASGLALVLYGLHRYRMRQLIAIERVRTRIATDLHDDIGSNLTRIALMSEVLNQQASNGAASTMLPSIANIARESVASMNDIVWAISPEHDRVLDLTRRMRQHAEEVFTIRDIEVDFVSETSDSELKLPVGIRRDVLLIFKEAVNNAARHSDCSGVRIEFACGSHQLKLRVADDGSGFSTSAESDGHGLSSMKRRADALGGVLDVDSREGVGTTVSFDMRL